MVELMALRSIGTAHKCQAGMELFLCISLRSAEEDSDRYSAAPQPEAMVQEMWLARQEDRNG